MKFCCVDGCDINTKQDVTYFKFPTSRLYRRKWIEAIKLDGKWTDKLLAGLVICNLHFKETDYEDIRGKIRLKGKVVPSIFEDHSSNKLQEQKECLHQPETLLPVDNQSDTNKLKSQQIDADQSKPKEPVINQSEADQTVIEKSENNRIENIRSSVDKSGSDRMDVTSTENDRLNGDELKNNQMEAQESENSPSNIDQSENSGSNVDQSENSGSSVDQSANSGLNVDQSKTSGSNIELLENSGSNVNQSEDDNSMTKQTTIHSEVDHSIRSDANEDVAETQNENVQRSEKEKKIKPVENKENSCTDSTTMDTSPDIDATRQDIEEMITNYQIKNNTMDKQIHRPEHVETVPELGVDAPPVFIEISVDKNKSDGDCMMVLESVQVDIDPSALMLEPPEELEISSDEEPTSRKADPISLLTSSDEDDVIIQEPKVDTVVVSSETDEDDVPLTRLVKKKAKLKKKSKRSINTQNITNVFLGIYDYYCVICKFTSTSRTEYKNHMKNHSTVLQVCQICGYTTASKTQLARHSKTHKDDRKFKCHLCDYKAKYSMSLIYHIKSHETSNQLSVSMSDLGGKFHKCAKCAFCANTKRELTEHLNVCSRVKKYSCAGCDYNTRRRSDLNRHVERRHKDLNVA